MTELTAAEVLNDLIQVNNERISRYEQLIAALSPSDSELRFLFARIIGESHQNKITLATELQAMGESIDLSPFKRGKVYQVAVENMDKFGEGSRLNILDHTDVCETAVLLGYDFSLRSDDVAAYLRDLLIEHQHRIREAHHQIKILKDQMA
jgi:uncharacterized protein (TIGR02284 family)